MFQEENIESSRVAQKEETLIDKKSEIKKNESVRQKSNFEDNDKAIYTNFSHRFVCDSKVKGTVFETFTNSSDLIDVSSAF